MSQTPAEVTVARAAMRLEVPRRPEDCENMAQDLAYRSHGRGRRAGFPEPSSVRSSGHLYSNRPAKPTRSPSRCRGQCTVSRRGQRCQSAVKSVESDHGIHSSPDDSHLFPVWDTISVLFAGVVLPDFGCRGQRLDPVMHVTPRNNLRSMLLEPDKNLTWSRRLQPTNVSVNTSASVECSFPSAVGHVAEQSRNLKTLVQETRKILPTTGDGNA